LDLGDWNNIRNIAVGNKLRIFLVAKSFVPSVDKWEEIHIDLDKLSHEKSLRLACNIATETRPDSMRYVTSPARALELWWD
jgi:hypothetical protein